MKEQIEKSEIGEDSKISTPHVNLTKTINQFIFLLPSTTIFKNASE
ncbi:hypothetical protein QG37_04610 [Candidozyma auris]|uniref:Uncharacterized protein n=1 Tax=Candidozyma auris TaxID=498019 RepID=A0A0L0NWX9_CANAR|nr:hypothetical protein QG37_04610 [[Candida] auris]